MVSHHDKDLRYHNNVPCHHLKHDSENLKGPRQRELSPFRRHLSAASIIRSAASGMYSSSGDFAWHCKRHPDSGGGMMEPITMYLPEADVPGISPDVALHRILNADQASWRTCFPPQTGGMISYHLWGR